MPIRMGGLQSGMDTEAMIKMMLEAELQPVNRLEDKVVEHEDDVYAWDMVDKSLAELGGISADLSSYTTWSQKSANTSDEAYMTATAERTAIPTSYTINVANLAVAHNIAADSIELTSLGVSNADTEIGKEGTFIINGQEISYETDDTLREIAEKINVASASMDNNTTANTFKAKIISNTLVLESGEEGTGNNLAIGEVTGTLLKDLNILSDTASGVDMGIDPTSQTVANFADVNTSLGLAGNINVNGTSYSVGASDSLADIRDLINSAGGSAEINADNTLSLTFGAYSYDSGDDVLELLGFAKPTVDRDADGKLDLDIPQDTTSSSYSDLGVSSTTSDLNLSGTFQMNGIDVKIETSHGLEDIKDLMNAAVPGSAVIEDGQIKIDSTGIAITGDSRHVFEDLGFKAKGSVAAGDLADEASPLGLTGSFDLGGYTVEVLETDTLATISGKIAALNSGASFTTVVGSGSGATLAIDTIPANGSITANDPDGILSRLGFSYSSTTSGIKVSDPKPTSISVYDFVDENFELGLSGDIVLDGNTISISAADSLGDIASYIDADAGYSAIISNGKLLITDGDLSAITDSNSILSDLGFPEEDTGTFELSSGVTGIKVTDINVSATDTTALNLSGNFTLNDSTINIGTTDTLTTISSKINALSGIASSVNSDGEITITGSPISVKEGTGNILQQLGLIGSSAVSSKMPNVINQDFDLGLTGEFTLDGVAVSVASTSSLEDIRAAIAAIDDDLDGTMDYKAEIIQGKLTVYSATSEDPVVFADTAGPDSVLQRLGITSKGVNITKVGITSKTANMNLSGRINFGGTFIDVDADSDDSTKASTLKELMEKINSDTSYTAKITSDNRLILDSGDITQISDPDGVLQSLGVLDTTNQSQTTYAEDLKATIDGIEVTASENQGVDSLIDGVNLTFLTEGVTSTVTVNNDTETIKTKLTEFIDKYNEVMELCEELGKVKLTDEGEVTAAGLLQGDFLITDIRNKARSIITQVNEEFLGTEFNSLDDIGIYTTGMDNRLSMIDEDKLDNALANHFDEMTTMFRGIEYDDDGEVVHKGIMREFDGFVMDMITPLTGRIGLKTETLTTQIEAKNTSIAKKRYDLQNYETYLWEHFANMESAMSSIQAGGQYMMQTLGM